MKIKAHYYINYLVIRDIQYNEVPLFFYLTTRANPSKNFVCFLGDLKPRKIASQIN